jgi:hypothetical protein
MNDELEIEGEFLRRIAQTDLTADEAKEFGGAMDDSVNQAPEESATAGDPIANENQELPNLDTDMDEMNAIKQLIPWDSFGIIFDPHYSKLLEETLGLPPAKAKAKSYYIYFSPENKRLEGVVNKRYIGGYGTKEDLGEDFAFIKQLSPEGFSPDWKEKLLTDIDELPAVENENVKEQLRDKADQSDQNEDQRIEKEEVETETPADNTVQFPSKSNEVAPPQPVGKVDTNQMPLAAKMHDITMRRMSRMKAFKSL